MGNNAFLQIAGARPFSAFLGGKRRSKKTLKRNNTKRITTKKKNPKRKTNKKSIKRKNISTKKRVEKRTQRKKSIKKTISKTKKRNCKCDNKKTYTGKEPSPKGLGYCAHCTPLHVTMKGKDGDLWENVRFRNSRRWVKVRKDMMGGFLRPGTF